MFQYIEVLLDHWGEDKEKARLGVPFICDQELKKQGDDVDLQAVWGNEPNCMSQVILNVFEGPRLESTNVWG